MVEQKTQNDSNNLEDTVRSLQEENAKLLQLLLSQGFPLESLNPSDGKANYPSNILFQNSDVTSTTNSINTTHQVNHQQINNYAPINQQNYSGQIVHGHQSNVNPNFNTIIQSSNQPFVQNNSNTLVQNNTNVIQPINLVNINNVSLDSIQSFLSTQNNLLYMPQTTMSTNSTTTTTTTTTTTNNTTNSTNNNSFNSNIMENDQLHQVSIRPKPIFSHSQQEMTSMLSKPKVEPLESLNRSISSSSNTETTNLLDNDLNHKQPRPILPKPLARAQSVQIYNSISLNETKPIVSNVLTPSPLINNTANTSSTVSILSPTTSFDEIHNDLSPQLSSSKSVDGSLSSNNNTPTSNKKPNKTRPRNRKPTVTTPTSIPSTTPTPIPIAPNLGRPLAPAPLNVQRIVTSTAKRSVTPKKRSSKPFNQFHSEGALQQSSSPPCDPFAESISGLLQNFDQELMASNFLSQTTVTTTNILSNESSNGNMIQPFDHIDLRHIVNTTIQQTDTFPTISSITDFSERNEQETTIMNASGQEFHVDQEQITSLMSDEEMCLVEMNFDENVFLKQFDMEESNIKFNTSTEPPLFASLLSSRQTSTVLSETSTSSTPPSLPPHPIYPGSSLINNNVFTTVVPLALQHQSSIQNPVRQQYSSSCAPEEGVQLTARHIEPSQVATYESGKYQDILDELVTVTDQDVLTHAQASAVDTVADQTVLSTDFTFDLIEATNEIIKTTDIEVAEEAASAFVDLQYFYPLEHEEVIEKSSDTDDIKHSVESNAPVESEPPAVIAPVDSPKSDVEISITDLSSIIQIGQIEPSSPLQSPPIDEVASVIDYDALLLPVQVPTPVRIPSPKPPTPVSDPLPKSPVHILPVSMSPVPAPSAQPLPLPSPPPPPRPPSMIPSPSLAPSVSTSITTNATAMSAMETSPKTSNQQPSTPPVVIENSSRIEASQTMNRPARIIFEPILSPENPSSPDRPTPNEMIFDSGHLNSSFVEKSISKQDQNIDSLMNDTSTNEFEIVESQGHVECTPHTTVENLDEFIDKFEEKSVEQTELNKDKIEINQSEDKQVKDEKAKDSPKEQYSPIPSVKLKLNTIYLREESKMAVTTPPFVPSPVEQNNSESIRAPIKIKIRTKLPLPPPPPPPPPPPLAQPENHQETSINRSESLEPLEKFPALPKLKIRKPIKKAKRRKISPSGDDSKGKEGKYSTQSEYAGLTRFEQSLAQLYHQSNSPAQGQIPPTPGDNDDGNISATNNDDQRQSSSPLTNENKRSIHSPLLTNQNSSKKLSHIFHGNDDQLTKMTFITPPPDIDNNHQQTTQQSRSSDDVYQSFKKAKKQHSSSSASSKVRHSSSGKTHNEPSRLLAQQATSLHLDSYAQTYHQFNAGSAPFFPFPFPNPYVNPHTSGPSNHFHPNPMKYHHPIHSYPNHQSPFNYHHHLQQQQQQHQQQYHNSSYMSSHEHHPFTR